MTTAVQMIFKLIFVKDCFSELWLGIDALHKFLVLRISIGISLLRRALHAINQCHIINAA